MFSPHQRPALLSALAALLVYAVTLGGTYVYDDLYIVQLDPRLLEASRWGEYWTRDYFYGGADNLYRPLVSMTYAVQSKLHGNGDRSAWAFHFVNWLLHAGVSAAVAELARRMSRGKNGIALLAGLLFAVHPVHVEAVANIVGRAELMCGLGIVLALALFLRPLTPRRALGIWACFVLAMLSKEQGILLPLLLIAAIPLRQRLLGDPSRALSPASGDAATGDSPRASTAPGATAVAGATDTAGASGAAGANEAPRATAPADVLPYASAATRDARRLAGPAMLLVLLLLWSMAAYILVRERLLKFWWDRSFLDASINPLVLSQGVDRALMPLALLGRYLALLVAPTRLLLDYGGGVIGHQARFDDPYLYLGLIAAFAWVSAGALAVLKRAWAVALCLFAMAVLWGLVSNALTLIGTIFAERLMYIPSVFACVLAAMLLARLPRRAMLTIAAVVIALYSVRTVTYAWRWNDRLRLFDATVAEWPQSGRLELLRGEELRRRGMLEEAGRALARARELEPTYHRVWITSAIVARDAGRLDLAEEYAARAQQLAPSAGGQQLLSDIRTARAATRPTTSQAVQPPAAPSTVTPAPSAAPATEPAR